MKKTIILLLLAIAIVSCTKTEEVEVVKTVVVTPTGTAMPDSLKWFFSDNNRVQSYNHTRDEFASYDSYTNSSPDYIIVSFGRNKSALNLPDSTLLPCNCITFTSYRNNAITSFCHYRIKGWTQEWKSEDMPNTGTASIKWNYQFFNKEYIYEIVPGSGSKIYRKNIVIKY